METRRKKTIPLSQKGLLSVVGMVSLLFVAGCLWVLYQAQQLQAGVRQRVTSISALVRVEMRTKKMSSLLFSLERTKNSPSKQWDTLRQKNAKHLTKIIAHLPVFPKLKDKVLTLKGLFQAKGAFGRFPSIRDKKTQRLFRQRFTRSQKLSRASVGMLRGQLRVLSTQLALYWRRLSLIALMSCFLALAIAILFVLYISRKVAWQRDQIALAFSEAHSQTILSSQPDTIMIVNREGELLQLHIGEANPLFLSSKVTYPQHIKRLFPSPYWGTFLPEFEALLLSANPRRVESSLSYHGHQLQLETRMAYINEEQILIMVRDVTEQKKTEQLKDDFIANISHELRTPLTSIMGSLSLLHHQFSGDFSGKPKQLLEVAFNNSQRLLTLITDLLEVQLLNREQLRFQNQKVELCVLVEEAIEKQFSYAMKRQVKLQFTGGKELLMCETDPQRLLQVLDKLLSNAIKFSQEEGKVEVRCSRSGENCRVEIQDYGVGISKHFQNKIFRPFSQEAQKGLGKSSGTGLGLSICKRWLEKLGGTLTLESELGEGSTFAFELPLLKEKPRILKNECPSCPGVSPSEKNNKITVS